MNKKPAYSKKSGPLKGRAVVPGDKSISHRSIMFGGLAEGETIISGLLEGEDVLSTAEAMRQLGARIEKCDDGLWRCYGVGAKGLSESDAIIDMGNSGTSIRLLMGVVAGYAMSTFFVGDASLSKRPMGRVITPLQEMGADFIARDKGRIPMAVKGNASLKGINYTLPVASAQVKSAILLAGLNATSKTQVTEPAPCRDHTENMLRHFGANIDVSRDSEGRRVISIEGGQVLQGCAVDVPSDPSSAAFPIVAAVLSPDSEVHVYGVCYNETRNGIYKTLIEMGADIEILRSYDQGGETVVDICAKGGKQLHGIDVPADRVPSMIDEFPILAVAACCAKGVTKMTGLEELRVKESDRLGIMAAGLTAAGATLEEGADSLTIHGDGTPLKGGVQIETHHDHRIAMSFLILGLTTDAPMRIDDASPIQTSFPNFVSLMRDIGAIIEADDVAPAGEKTLRFAEDL